MESKAVGRLVYLVNLVFSFLLTIIVYNLSSNLKLPLLSLILLQHLYVLHLSELYKEYFRQKKVDELIKSTKDNGFSIVDFMALKLYQGETKQQQFKLQG